MIVQAMFPGSQHLICYHVITQGSANNWRMQLAANHLLSGTDSVASIANRVGYDSEAALSRAFKEAVGTPPGEWRRRLPA